MDDSGDFVGALKDFLGLHPLLEVEAVTHSGAEALQVYDRMLPDGVVADLKMDKMDGLELTRLLKAKPAPPLVVIVSLHNRKFYEKAALEAGADGYVSKYEVAKVLAPLLAKLYSEKNSSGGQSDDTAHVSGPG
ncbi:MAG: response regulator transcription factor [Rhodospirillales bacterium]|nr:response regulator transcription factor [Rhodospirillales bacterium]